MISFWVPAAGAFGIEEWIAQRAPELADRIQVRTYESLTPEFEVSGGAHIFAAFCQLTPAGRETVTALYDQLAGSWPTQRLLNNPRRVTLRYQLLTRLHQAGINQFQVRRATDLDGVVRFPVFLREESGHTGALTGLLQSSQELRRGLLSLRARGFRESDLLVVELRDLSDGEGVFRMAAAFKVGDRIVPAFMIRSRHFMLKWDESDHSEQAMRETLEYVVENPHEPWLRHIFAVAGVDYGRLDYGVRAGTLQVWEINLNPTPGPRRGPPPPPLAPEIEAPLQESRRIYNRALRDAFCALEPETDQRRATVRLDPALVARMRAETAGVRRRGAALGLLHRIYRHRIIGWPFRTAYSRLFPRQ